MGLKHVFNRRDWRDVAGVERGVARGSIPGRRVLQARPSKAVLSPKPLGPATQFAPFPVQAGTDPAGVTAQARAEPRAAAGMIVSRTPTAHVGVKKPQGAARTRLAHRHGNPLDAQASDTRIQVWPCKSGGICDWRRPAPGR